MGFEPYPQLFSQSLHINLTPVVIGSPSNTSYMLSDSPPTTIKELPATSEPQSEPMEPQSEATEPQPAATKFPSEVIEPQSEATRCEAAHDPDAGGSDTESDGEMEEGDEAEDKADKQKDDHAMEGDTAQREHDQLKQLIAHHQKLLQAKKQLLSDEKVASTMFDLECLNCYNEM